MPGAPKGSGIRWVRRGNRLSTIPIVRTSPNGPPRMALSRPSATAASSTAAAYDDAAAEPDALENARMLLQDHTGMAQ